MSPKKKVNVYIHRLLLVRKCRFVASTPSDRTSYHRRPALSSRSVSWLIGVEASDHYVTQPFERVLLEVRFLVD